MNRRHVLMSAMKLGTLSVIGAPFVARAQTATMITVASWGGSWGDVLKEYWIKPFTAETGIAVELVVGPDLARVKAQVASNNILWDVVDGLGYVGVKEGLWEPIDFKIVDPARFIVKPPSFAVPVGTYTGGIAYDPSHTKNSPQDFAQFWNVKDFPGRRGLRNRASETLEMALLADGVAPSVLYPLDVERAFKSLDQIKPNIKKWFTATAEGVSLIQRSEVDYTYTYTNRVKAAKETGVSIDFAFGQCITNMQYFNVVRGTPRKEAAMRFLEFITRPEQQAAVANKQGTGAAVKGVEKMLSEEARRWIPDPNNPKNVFYDNEYWADHFVDLDKRFKEWILT